MEGDLFQRLAPRVGPESRYAFGPGFFVSVSDEFSDQTQVVAQHPNGIYLGYQDSEDLCAALPVGASPADGMVLILHREHTAAQGLEPATTTARATAVDPYSFEAIWDVGPPDVELRGCRSGEVASVSDDQRWALIRGEVLLDLSTGELSHLNESDGPVQWLGGYLRYGDQVVDPATGQHVFTGDYAEFSEPPLDDGFDDVFRMEYYEEPTAAGDYIVDVLFEPEVPEFWLETDEVPYNVDYGDTLAEKVKLRVSSIEDGSEVWRIEGVPGYAGSVALSRWHYVAPEAGVVYIGVRGGRLHTGRGSGFTELHAFDLATGEALYELPVYNYCGSNAQYAAVLANEQLIVIDARTGDQLDFTDEISTCGSGTVGDFAAYVQERAMVRILPAVD